MLKRQFTISRVNIICATPGWDGEDVVCEFLIENPDLALKYEQAMYEAAILLAYTGKTPAEFISEDVLNSSESAVEFVDGVNRGDNKIILNWYGYDSVEEMVESEKRKANGI